MREKAVKVPGLEPEIRVRPPKQQISTPSRHSLKCAICNHPDRAAIEFDFLNWRNPGDLVKSYHFRGLSTIYRHAHATGLFARRRLNLRFAMERIVERVNEVPVTASSVIRAARAIARINDSGEWVDPPSRVIVTHIHAEDSSFVGAPRGTGSQHVDSSVEVSSEDRQATVGTEDFVGRGGTCPDRSVGNRDKKPRSSKPSIRARQGGEGNVPSIPAHDSSETISRPSLIFDDALLDEPSDSASAELPRIEGKPAPPEIILELSPEFARCREERRRAIEADRQARAAHSVAPGDRGPTTREQDVAPFSSTLPEAAPDQLAPASMAPSPARETQGAIEGQSVASPSSLLPQAAVNPPTTACPEQGRGAKQSPRAAGPPLGSSGSADPPFPFTQESRRRWKPRRRF